MVVAKRTVVLCYASDAAAGSGLPQPVNSLRFVLLAGANTVPVSPVRSGRWE